MAKKRVDKKKSDAYFIAFSIIFIAFAAILFLRNYSANLSPTSVVSCPKMTDTGCGASRVYADSTVSLNDAYKKTMEKCNTEVNNCVTNQDAEKEKNKQSCEMSSSCVFNSALTKKDCAVSSCSYTTPGKPEDRKTCSFTADSIILDPKTNIRSFPPPSGNCVPFYTDPSIGTSSDVTTYSCEANGVYNQDSYQCYSSVASATPSPTATSSPKLT